MHFPKRVFIVDIADVGKTIQQRRGILKITQNDLAEISGVSLRSVKALESGKGNPRFNQLEKVLNALGLAIVIEERIRHV